MSAPSIGVVRSSRPIVVGSGIAGLTTALSLQGSTVVTASRVGTGSSWLAQGGLAAAIGRSDSPAAHAEDTVRVGGDIVERALAETIAAEAPGRVDWLEKVGARFDTGGGGELVLGREAGHSHRRIVHAGGDATGAEIMRALRVATVVRDDIELLAETRLVDLIRSGDRIVGVLVVDRDGHATAHIAPAVVLATGGIGGIYARSTNPADVTGAGIATAARQGAQLADLEFVQFHPTAIAAIDHPAPLISEALRGEGATLVDDSGRRFMPDLHPDAELAPRDVVARAIWGHRAEGHRVFLDTRDAIGDEIADRFPTAYRVATTHGIDPVTQAIEIAPAEHFHMGGVATDADGATSLPGLWAAGEVASTGLHGANRLASNSLLEGLVMGRRVAAAIDDLDNTDSVRELTVPLDAFDRIRAGLEAQNDAVRGIAWDDVGIVRSGTGLVHALDRIAHLDGPTSNAALVARLVAESALSRRESRGAHHRTDFPESVPGSAHRSFVTPAIRDLVALDTRVQAGRP